MNEKKLFYKNIELWTSTDSQAAMLLPYIHYDHLKFCKTSLGELNLKEIIEEKTQYHHSQKGALNEAKTWFDSLNLDKIEVLYVYGLGLGYAYDAAAAWLKKSRKRQLIFLEDDLAVIARFFETERAEQILRDSRVKIVYFDKLNDPLSLLNHLFWNSMTVNIQLSALPYYRQQKAERFDLLEHKLYYDATLRESLLDEYLRYGIVYFRNFYPNILDLSEAYLGDALFGKFSSVPAVICGAGPSLTKQIPLLKKIQDQALIFAGGSALNALNAAGFQPHLGAGIDPNPEQLVRLQTQKDLQLPFFYRNRMYHPALSLVKGPRLYISGSGGYDVAHWFEEKCGIPHGEEALDEGFNVVNFCISIAHAMGCSPILLVGLDLAYTDMQLYAPGVIKEDKVKVEQLLEAKNLDDKPLLWKDIYGKPVYTLWKWIAEANWIEEFAKQYPEANVTNVTEGGIGVVGVPNIPFKEMIKKQFSESAPVSSTSIKKKAKIRERLQKEIQKATLKNVTKTQLIGYMHELKSSLERSLQLLQVLSAEATTLEKQVAAQHAIPEASQSGRAALAETELADEPGYRAVLEIFNGIYSKILNRELQQHSARPRPSWKQVLIKLRLLKKRYLFLSKVTVANLALMEHVLSEAASSRPSF